MEPRAFTPLCGVIVGIDGVLVLAHSDKQDATVTWKKTLPLHDTAQNRIWLEIISLALDLLAWMPMLALTGQTRRWEPKKLRLRLFSGAAHFVNTGRRHWLRFTARWPWTDVITHAIDRLRHLMRGFDLAQRRGGL